ncbi:hypothetical protein QLL95_gp0397 [Cotonvirus japonicus]|uniref:Uncharacterized protein n=1 Tax=Cotonvirus japonicus TaxID=2811091 RepID=A0ABM7NUE8_9VIRU|nr:hypothetical protein QLL95_gp0397 [Cotonvirus japonicus]BCS83726.1 hypothetical protein [Cotonvirus japonicus]
MKIDDFIDFEQLKDICTKNIIKCNLDKDHKIYNGYGGLLPEKNEILLLMTKAKNSFLSHKKIKNKYLKDINKKNIKPRYSSMNLQIFLSRDNKYYCVNFNYNHIDDRESENIYKEILNFVGIFEKKSGKFFAMTFYYNPFDELYLCMSNNKYDIIDYRLNYKSITKKNPLDIVVKLEDRFNDSYDKIHEQICKNIEEEENSDSEKESESDSNEEIESD